jgi:hypothetical protein
MKQDKCRSCGAAIIWSETIHGRRMPLDTKPTLEGNIILGFRHQQAPLALIQTEQALAPLRAKHEKLFVSHFVTCPQASGWRKR